MTCPQMSYPNPPFTAQLVCQMLETHAIKCREGLYGGRPSRGAGKLMEGGLLRDYLNENEGQVKRDNNFLDRSI